MSPPADVPPKTAMTLSTSNFRARLVYRPVELDCPPYGEMLEAFARMRDPAMLESAAVHADYGRYTLLACEPLEILTLRNGRLLDGRGTVLAQDDESLWHQLNHAFGSVELVGHEGTKADWPDACPYMPGWIGYIGYEIARHIERLPGRAAADIGLPDLRLAFYDALLVYDTLDRKWALLELVFENPPARWKDVVAGPATAGRAGRCLLNLARPARGEPQPPAAADATEVQGHRPGAGPAAAAAVANFTPDAYRRAVARCIEYIAAGDIFQVNLSQRFRIAAAPPPMNIYRVLRAANPAWYAAYLSFENDQQPCAIVSSSPELFLRVRGKEVLTRPIKGTRRRTGDETADEAARNDLWDSPKDNAELAMIIDLLRNDLGRVCRFGSVEVVQARRLEAHPTVYHLVGTVTGTLRDSVSVADLLRATLPGGSITGAPKIRAMEIIDELEGVARGVYTGCIGIVGVDGSCEWNIAIRTLVHDGQSAYVQAGGGIVADSDPQGEYVETLDKARALLEAIATAASPGPGDGR